MAIDGKTLRGSYDKIRRRGAIHVINAFSIMSGVVLGQLKTAEGSNKITTRPDLINMIDVKGKIIATDANKEFKAGSRRKMRLAEVDRKYLASVLAGCGVS